MIACVVFEKHLKIDHRYSLNNTCISLSDYLSAYTLIIVVGLFGTSFCLVSKTSNFFLKRNSFT